MKTQKKDTPKIPCRAEAVSVALIESLLTKVEEIPDTVQVGIVLWERNNCEVSIRVKIHMTFKDVTENFFSIRLLDFNRYGLVSILEGKIQLLGNPRREW